MSAALIPFPKTPIRAFVVVPGDEVTRDWCTVKVGGYAVEAGPCVTRGPLAYVLYHLQADPRGLPVAVHPECRRRAGQ
jgi:hypothetical protein